MDLPIMRWVRPNTKGSRPNPRYFHAMSCIGDAVIVIGGKDDHTRFTDVHVFNKDAGSCQWAQPHIKGIPPKPRSAHSICVIENKVYVFGGHRDGEKFNDLHVLDTSVMCWGIPKTKGKVPGRRNAHAASVLGRSFYIFGGFDGESCNDFHSFDTVSNVWSQPTTTTPPHKRCCHTMTTINNSLWVFAGKNNDSNGVIGRFNDIHSIDPTTGKWIDHAPNITGIPPSKRNAHTACDYRNYLLIFGGFDGDSCNDLFMFNTLTLTWQELIPRTPPPASRYCHTAISYQSTDGLSDWSMLLFGGCDSDHNYSDVQLLEIGLGRLRADKQVEECDVRIKSLEVERSRLNKLIQKQNDTILKLRNERLSAEDSSRKSFTERGDSDDSSGDPQEEKKKKKRKKRKSKKRNTAEDNQEGLFEDEQHQLNGSHGTSQRQSQPRPPAHLAPLELARLPRTAEPELLNTCPSRGLANLNPTLFPPLRV
eukprot:TRINITY_DN13321_c0_g1_i4.p1 TRINITY_DN13321_c0_g1~~TRINITY_DN13321_c0_g1_i4.p1  ORF type:complete len:501 (+),score=88.78 TRINITY_DN13321_c0_g1_i4:68-1504(+)